MNSRFSGLRLSVVLLSLLLLGLPAQLLALQPEPAAHGAPGTAPQAEHAAEAEAHAEGGLLEVVARLANFGILVGVLFYLLRSPVGKYLSDRRQQVRHDLEAAIQMRRAATEQVAEIDRRLAMLPGEIDALRVRGAEEIAAEEERIRLAAATERERLLEQTRREIDLRLRAARRELLEEAAELSVGLASERIGKTMTAADQQRLLDQYLEQIGRRRP